MYCVTLYSVLYNVCLNMSMRASGKISNSINWKPEKNVNCIVETLFHCRCSWCKTEATSRDNRTNDWKVEEVGIW
jgi:hypothetical protein